MLLLCLEFRFFKIGHKFKVRNHIKLVVLFLLNQVRRDNMNDKIRQEYNKYMREYRKNNKEKIKEIKQRYWEKKVLGNEEEFKKELKEDSTTMKELRTEKLTEKVIELNENETFAFYVEDLDSEILKEIENN